MKKILLFATCLSFFYNVSILADEGMWLLPLLQQLNAKKMDSMGLKISADDIYNINHSSIKDAIVMFDGGCTGEVVSDQGLMLTNHHCGLDYIRQNSSINHDYLKDGFWALEKSQEIPSPDLAVTFLVRMEDVTDKVNSALKGSVTESIRKSKIEKISDDIKNEAIKGTHYEAAVQDLFGGNKFYLFVYEKFEDVRFVGAPPYSIGNFGDETDNWMWPRHTGDFSVFRIYSGPDGEPAKYSKNNIPLKPKYHLPVSLKGIGKDDFTMVIGYPGETFRYLTSFGVKEIMDIENVNRIKIRGLRLKSLLDDMQSSEEIRIKYASKYNHSSNYWKFSIGQNKGITDLKVIDRKKEQEARFSHWVKEDSTRLKKYGDCLGMIETSIISRKWYNYTVQYLRESLIKSVDAVDLASNFFNLYVTLKTQPDSTAKINTIITGFKKTVDEFYRDYNAPTDMKVAKTMFKIVGTDVPENFQPTIYAGINKKYKGNYDKYVDYIYQKSMFPYKEKVLKFLEKPDLKTLLKDPIFQASLSVFMKYWELNDSYNTFTEKLNLGQRLYVAGTMEMDSSKAYYPDANFTMRLTYGTVGDYDPRDAVHYKWFSTLKGVMEKEDSTNHDFIVSQKLKELYNNRDFGRYGQNGVMCVDFTTNNDITGGNSGSPVLNGNGELIGLAFDGNWESMSGDIVYEPLLQKCICVDIRYVLFIMDKYAGAKKLVDEMKIVE
jgi:hypothetical protein